MAILVPVGKTGHDGRWDAPRRYTERNGGNPIGDRILLHPIVGALSAGLMIVGLSFILGDVPNAGIVAGFMLIGVGLGMVVARFGNMGPFQGEFGSPWFEIDLGETIRKEAARASRFDRDLSIVAVRQRDGAPVQWTDHVRQADDVIACRNGWYLLILPETSKDGAQAMIERVTEGLETEIQAAIMDPSGMHRDPQELGRALVDLVRNPPETVATGRRASIRRDTDRLHWPAG